MCLIIKMMETESTSNDAVPIFHIGKKGKAIIGIIFLLLFIYFIWAVTCGNCKHAKEKVKSQFKGVVIKKYMEHCDKYVIKNNKGTFAIDLLSGDFCDFVEVGDSVIKIKHQNVAVIIRRKTKREVKYIEEDANCEKSICNCSH